ncbi:MAG: hypothetical protein HY698_17435 [Deltaproteobacteria bacterium]|nr:hypothetical protein [Deltaproteobacteria bacterium]
MVDVGVGVGDERVLQRLGLHARKGISALDRLSALEQAGSLGVPRKELAESYLHLCANRLLRASGKVQEVELWDALVRVFRSFRARGLLLA